MGDKVEYQVYPFPKSMSQEAIMAGLDWPKGTKIVDGGGAWVLMVPTGVVIRESGSEPHSE